MRLVGALLLALSLSVAGAAAQSDGPRAELAVDDFLRRVAAHHPVARQARLVVDQAREEARAAAGAFDPTVSAAWEQKRFGATEYYDYATASLTVPTPLGVDFKVGWERADGRYANPDRRTPSGGLLSAGLSLPIGQRIVTDERRTALAVARSVRDAAGAERDALVNRVLLQAARDYARWFEAERRAEVARGGVGLADFRLAAVRRRVAAGETAPLDTIEALLEVQRRRALVVEAEQARYAARLGAEVHLWDARGHADTLPAHARPAGATTDELRAPDDVARLVATAEREHPDVLRARARVEQAAAQHRLAAQQRIPYAAAELGTLGDAGGGGLEAPVPGDDLEAGLVVRSPLLFLRERGRANAAALRVEQLRVERDRARREVAAAVRVAAGELTAAREAGELQRGAVALARRLVDGEQRRFEAGESTLFLVNLRERTLLDEQLRLASLEARALAARAELGVARGAWLAGGEHAP